MSIAPQSGLDFVTIGGGSEGDAACAGEAGNSGAEVQPEIIAIVRATSAVFTTAGRPLIRLEGSLRPPACAQADATTMHPDGSGKLVALVVVGIGLLLMTTEGAVLVFNDGHETSSQARIA